MNGLDLFSGIGGISIALSDWIRPIAYCENDRYCQSVLLSRMRSGDISEAPIWDDVRTLKRMVLPTKIEIIYGGFPCQDISVAGNGAGLGGQRSGLFFEIIRLMEELRPTFVFLENVPAIRTRGLREVIRAFTDLRYDCRWTCVSAAEVGAPHLRKRWFLLAHTDKQHDDNRRHGTGQIFRKRSESAILCTSKPETLANPNGERLQSGMGARGCEQGIAETADSGWWATEPTVGRVANGLPHRVDRLKCLGNAVVPTQAREAFKRLMGI